MGIGDYKPPPRGPETTPTKDIEDLDPEQLAELGDLASLSPEVVTPVKKPVETIPEEDLPPLARDEPLSDEALDDVAVNLEALQQVVDEDLVLEDPEKVAGRPTPEEKQNFMRSILGNKAYSKEYALFGGMILVTMRDLTPDQEDRIYSQLAMDQAAKRIKTQDDWELMLDRYRALFGIKNLRQSGQLDSDSTYILPEDLQTSLYEPANKYLTQTFSTTTIYRSVMRTVRIFRHHLEALFERSLDADFWEVDGLDSPSEHTSKEPSTTPASPISEAGD